MMLKRRTSDKRTKAAIACAAAAIILAGAVVYPLLLSNSSAVQLSNAGNPLSDTTFPPPISSTISSQPSYGVKISDPNGQSTDQATFSPSVISIPAGMTVIWTNDGAGQHTVTTVSSSDYGYAPPEAIDSKMIAPDGGSFAFTFTKPGVYKYTDMMNPKATGIVDVGSTYEKGANFEMQIGGTGSTKSSSGSGPGLTLRFVPTTLSIPPTTAITYQVAVASPEGKTLLTKNFDDVDGILDLELVPQSAAAGNSNLGAQFVTWGPDFAGQEGYGNTGTFHIQGPFTSAGQYSVTITALAKDNTVLNDVTDTFSIVLHGK